MGDGSVRFIDEKISDEVLKGMVTINGPAPNEFEAKVGEVGAGRTGSQAQAAGAEGPHEECAGQGLVERRTQGHEGEPKKIEAEPKAVPPKLPA